jgi:hypothetical protein
VERNLIALGIKPITSRPLHPQTCGKNERGHQTLQRWLAARPTAATLVALQGLLDCYQADYNNRPHQGLDSNQTPLERRIVAARRPATPVQPDQPTVVRHCAVNARGYLSWDGVRIAVGAELAGRMLAGVRHRQSAGDLLPTPPGPRPDAGPQPALPGLVATPPPRPQPRPAATRAANPSADAARHPGQAHACPHPAAQGRCRGSGVKGGRRPSTDRASDP